MAATPGTGAHGVMVQEHGQETDARSPLSTVGLTRRFVIPRWLVLALAVAAEAIFGQVATFVPMIAALAAAVVAVLVVFAALTRNTMLSLCLIAYIPALEITIRQVRAPVPYLYAPYLLIAISVFATFTVYNQLTKPGRTALLYFVLLVPSVIATISIAGSEARELIVFALSGPLAMATMVVFLSQVRLAQWMHQRLLWILLVSSVAPLAVAVTSIQDYIATVGAIDFTQESNFVTSGGFGPVQVSSLMGLSVVISVMVFVRERDVGARAVAAVIGLVAVTMSFLTFSRGGMTAAALAIAAYVIAQTANPRDRRRVGAIIVVILAVSYLVIYPWLDTFTNGKVEERFTDTKTTRGALATNDFEIFRDNVAFGVGPGMTKYNRLGWEVCHLRQDRCENEGSSHTEFTRMLGEHGIAGLAAIGVMALLPVQALRRSRGSRAITVSFLVWSIAQMFYANFRISAVAVVFAFAFLEVDSHPPPDPLAAER